MTATPSARVVTVSTRAANGTYADRAGPIAVDWLAALGFDVDDPVVVPDGPEVEKALRDAVDAEVELVITVGGTGLTRDDRTPEATRRIVDHEVPGLSEAIREHGRTSTPTASLSRGLAGVAGRTLIVNLPGSVGGVTDGMDVLSPLVRHAVDELHDRRDGDAPGHGHGHGSHRHHVGADETPGEVVAAVVTEAALDVAAHERAVDRPGAGAVVAFSGVVRDNDAGRTVLRLEYSGHPSAETVVRDIATAAAERPGVAAVAVSHRLGALDIGDVALACAVSGVHRAEAFEACRWIVDEVKRRLPVWKHQFFADGTDEWVNCP